MGGRHPFAFTAEKPSLAQAAVSSANVVPFNKRGRLLAKLEPITSARSSRPVMPPPSTATGGARSGWCRPKGGVIDFAHAYQDRHAAKGPKYRSKENEAGLALTDYAATAYVVLAVAFYPALAWLFSP
jgi:hypothetical protein